MKIRESLTVVFTVDVPLQDIKGHESLTPKQIAKAAYEEALLQFPVSRQAYVVLRDSNLVGTFEILESGTPGEDFIEIR